MKKNLLLNTEKIDSIIKRLACEIIENNISLEKTCLIGIKSRGDLIARRICKKIFEINGYEIKFGHIDVTFYRDDFRRREKTLKASSTDNLNVEGKNIVLVDDVLFTGRSIRAALTAIETFGRPNQIELMILIDRRYSRHLPIQPDYRGRQIDVYDNQKVIVNWKEKEENDSVYIIDKK